MESLDAGDFKQINSRFFAANSFVANLESALLFLFAVANNK